MNRKLLTALAIESLLIIMVLLACFLMYVGDVDLQNIFTGPQAEAPEPGTAPSGPPRQTEYLPNLNLPQIKAEVEVFGNIAAVRQEIRLTAPTERFQGNIYAKNYADVTITGVGTDSGLSSYSEDGLMLDIAFSAPGGVIYIDYYIELRQSEEILSWSEDMIRLTNFLIMPAVRLNGEIFRIYHTNFGDPFLYDLYDYDITVTVDKKYTAYAQGKTAERPAGTMRSYVFSGKNMRDFPIVICGDTTITAVDKNGVRIYYINDASDCATFVDYSMEFAGNNIGAYPYDEFFVVRTPITGYNGMEFSGMIFLSDSAFGNTGYLKNLTYHEVFHQWFYGAIGTDRFNEPFMAEGMATYLASYLITGGGTRYYDPSFVGRSLADYRDKEQYERLAYSQASNYFSSVQASMGDRFFDMLKEIYKEKGHGRLYYTDFLGYVERFSRVSS